MIIEEYKVIDLKDRDDIQRILTALEIDAASARLFDESKDVIGIKSL